jgi:hypothetical protein
LMAETFLKSHKASILFKLSRRSDLTLNCLLQESVLNSEVPALAGLLPPNFQIWFVTRLRLSLSVYPKPVQLRNVVSHRSRRRSIFNAYGVPSGKWILFLAHRVNCNTNLVNRAYCIVKPRMI